MKNFTTILILFCVGVLAYTQASSQQTGSFDVQIQFMGEDRTLSMYVPEDYNADNSYNLLLGLHGSGDTSSNYRNALIQHYKWNEFITNTIFIFPDGGSDISSDFYSPEGDNEIIIEALNYAMSNYNINTDEVILQGFSLGGRSALKFGLENYEMFKGLMLNTPAIQSMHDLNNNPIASLVFKYENADKIPIAINVGEEDSYLNINSKLFLELIKHKGITEFISVPEMGHTITSKDTIQLMLDFINTPAPNELDADFIQFDNPDRICFSSFAPKASIRNKGQETIQSVHFMILHNNLEMGYTWTGEIKSFEFVEIILPEIELNSGINIIQFAIDSINSIQKTENIEVGEIIVEYLTSGIDIPYAENMYFDENILDNWLLYESGNLFTWRLQPVSSQGSAQLDKSLFMFNWAFYPYNEGYSEELISPSFNLEGANSPQFKFDVAFNYHKFTPPLSQQDVTFSDTLRVLLSTDCGETFTQLYEKYGDDLATVDNPIENPDGNVSPVFTPQSNQWRTETIDLSPYTGEKNVIIKFSYASGMGGVVFLDEFIVEEPTSVSENIKQESFIFPNPASVSANIDLSKSGTGEKYITVFNLLGEKVFEINSNSSEMFEIDVNGFESGLYFVHIESDNGKTVDKLIVR